jgi:hypothetical protein
MKFFYENDDAARYAEFFTNIDIPNGRIEIREKDPEYRAAIVKALTLHRE